MHSTVNPSNLDRFSKEVGHTISNFAGDFGFGHLRTTLHSDINLMAIPIFIFELDLHELQLNHFLSYLSFINYRNVWKKSALKLTLNSSLATLTHFLFNYLW